MKDSHSMNHILRGFYSVAINNFVDKINAM